MRAQLDASPSVASGDAVVSKRIQVKSQLLDSIKKAAFILGGFLLVFIAARNSITWHLQKFWGASGDFWQSQWNAVYALFGKDDIMIAVVGTSILTISVFWIANALLLVLDITGRPNFLLQYKIQEDKDVPVDRKKLVNAVKQVIFNQTVVGIPFFYLSAQLLIWRGCSMGGELPTFQWVVLEIIVFTLVEEFCFYYSHRLLHHPKLYKYIHKRHHEWTAPIGITAIYAHPVEHIMSNIIPPTLGPLLMGSHLATSWMWFAIALLSTTVSHSGYHFPLLPSPEAHDYHHLKFNQNYGVLGVLDRLHGTDNQFRASPAYQRHILLLGLMPLSKQIPDPPKKNVQE